MRLTDLQINAIRQTLKEYGTLALAAEAAGLTPTRLRALINTDQDLAEMVEDALATHGDLIYQTALERATSGKSDLLLGRLLEAKVDGFSKESRVPANLKNRPTGLRLRTFDEKGEEVGAQDIEPKPEGPPLQLPLARYL
jgi:hypothetical protein